MCSIYGAIMRTAKSRAELTERYCDLQRKTVLPQLKKGLSALVYLQIVKSLHIPVTLVPMLFQNGRYYSRLLSIKSENVRVKPLMFQERSEVWQCLQS